MTAPRQPHRSPTPTPNYVFCHFCENKKDARRPYDHFGGGVAPRSLLCVRKRRFPFLKPRCFCAAKIMFWGNRLPEPGNQPPPPGEPAARRRPTDCPRESKNPKGKPGWGKTSSYQKGILYSGEHPCIYSCNGKILKMFTCWHA